MSTSITVPADVAKQLRRALYADLARAGAQLEEACSTEEPGDVASPVGKLRRLFAVLDEIGWSKEPPSPGALTIDRRHLRVIVDTLKDDWDRWEWAAEQPHEDLPDRERATAITKMIEQFLASLPQPAAPPIPAGCAARVREGSRAVLREVAAELALEAEDPDACRLLYARLQETWRLLDALGDEDTEVQLDPEHTPALLAALDLMLPLMQGWLNEIDPADPALAERTHELQVVGEFAANCGLV